MLNRLILIILDTVFFIMFLLVKLLPGRTRDTMLNRLCNRVPISYLNVSTIANGTGPALEKIKQHKHFFSEKK